MVVPYPLGYARERGKGVILRLTPHTQHCTRSRIAQYTCNRQPSRTVTFGENAPTVWESYRTSSSFGYGYGSVTELTEVPEFVARAYRTHRSSGWVQKMLYPYPGYCGTGRTDLTEVPGTGMMCGTGNTRMNTRPRGRGLIGSEHYRQSSPRR